MTDLDLKRIIGAALMVPPTDNWHYPLSENQLRHLITQAVEAEREACAKVSDAWDTDHPETNYGRCIADAIRARG
jgi:hypothetical protein